ncbi:mannitol dehydrogenase family protein [Jannaschia ovalis]|uniref:Mannitol dehydrogenase family protein n=1 Tax=Jannaschia ovalis TaxID=3038773 RepID=A0ABY8L771_9RHOB|nr:mannitol dehydrogenase family protein [Jannaschia sp. GRR-S6-38]WGH77232.1 mannitol dehydrogenase family protein [Jannaschia sp. GRR-S6-38]
MTAPRLAPGGAARPKPGWLHLGPGAFFRAFGLPILQEVGGDWGVIGVSLRSPATRDALAPQGFAYTALERGPDGPRAAVIEQLRDILVAPEDPRAVLDAMADPGIRVVSLTVTEKGYCHDPATGRLNPDHPDIRHDLAAPLPRSAPGFLTRALAARRAAGHRPFTVLSCDNLPDNGALIRGVVLELARRIDPALADWIAAEGAFPATMVDRIVPATTPEDIAAVARLTGRHDAAPVVHEPFRQWVVTDAFVDGARPPLERAGVQMVSDVASFEAMKLRMLNGTHSALAYLGSLSGHETIAEAVAHPVLRAFTRHLWSEIVPTLTPPPGTDLAAYADALLARYDNAAIRHRTLQIAMDGSQKLPQRILGTLRDRLDAGAEAEGLLAVVAAWMRHVGGTDEAGRPLDLRDPLAEELRARARAADPVASLLGLRVVFDADLAARIRAPLTRLHAELATRGAITTAERIAR